MAGIGFELRRLAQTDRLSTNVAGMVYATAVSSGPWLLTCLALVLMRALGEHVVDGNELRRFSILVTYSFSFSLVVSGPIVLVVTRCLADAIYANDVSRVSDLFVSAMGLLFLAALAMGLPLYGVLLDLSLAERLVALVSFVLTNGIWLVAAFLTALKSYRLITSIFAIGMLATVACAALLVSSFGGLGMLAALAVGLGLIFFTLSARVFAEFPGTGVPSRGLFAAFRGYWELALVGLLYNAAIWVDKWIMWWMPGAISPGAGLLSHPTYEGGMFLAFLSVVPSMTLFLVVTETRFFDAYTRFYRDIGRHATLVEIRHNHVALVSELADASRRTAALQVVICLLGILAAPMIIQAIGAGEELMPVFRYGLYGALFHVLLTLAMAALAYFDLRRDLLFIATIFLVLNAALTAFFGQLGMEFHGYGYGLATLLSCALAFVLTAHRVARLPYLTFVANNAGLRSNRRPAPAPAPVAASHAPPPPGGSPAPAQVTSAVAGALPQSSPR